jgi:hypothetical protein
VEYKMSLGYWLIGWSKEKRFWTAGIVFALLLIIFVAINIGAGPSKEISGVVSVVGMNTATRYELPIPMITVVLENGETIIVEGIRGITVKPEDRIILFESKRLLTPGTEYRFLKVIK